VILDFRRLEIYMGLLNKRPRYPFNDKPSELCFSSSTIETNYPFSILSLSILNIL
jgi:hypothetical protein